MPSSLVIVPKSAGFSADGTTKEVAENAGQFLRTAPEAALMPALSLVYQYRVLPSPSTR